MAVPYKTEKQIRDQYENLYKKSASNLQKQADQQSAATNANYDNTQKGNYVHYMQTMRTLPENLARQGINGGASETSLLRARTNYENNTANTERARQSDLTNINTALTNALNERRLALDSEMMSTIENNNDKKRAYEQALQEQRENRYAKTISGWDTISGIDKEIANIKKSGKNTWRIAYLRARRAELVAAEKEAAEAEAKAAARSGGGGGYSSRSSYSSKGGNTGGTSNTKSSKTPNAISSALGAYDKLQDKAANNTGGLRDKILAAAKSRSRKSTKVDPWRMWNSRMGG